MLRELCMVRGEKTETVQRKVDGGRERKRPVRDGGEKRKMDSMEVYGEKVKGKETHHPETERGTMAEEGRTGSATKEERRRGVAMQACIDTKTGIETKKGTRKGKGIEEETGTEIMKETEKKRGIDTEMKMMKKRG